MDFQIISDGSCDLTLELREKYNIQVVPFYVSFDGENYQKEIDEIDIREVYERMVEDPETFPKTSLPSVQNFADAFLPHVKEGRAVICMTITNTLSGAYNAACNAREIILEDYPDAQITVINSLEATVSQGIYAIEAAKMRDAGYSYEKTVAVLKGEMMDRGRIFFTVGDLTYLQHGGRIGKLAGMAGSMLRLKPIITLKDGSIDSSGVARSRKKSIAKVLELTKLYFQENNEDPRDYIFSIGFGYDKEEGIQFKGMIDELLKELGVSEQSRIVQIGATICVHTGPYAIGVGIMKKYEACAESHLSDEESIKKYTA